MPAYRSQAGRTKSDPAIARCYAIDVSPNSCSSSSFALGEPLFATAGQATGWVLVEQPGAWKRDPLATGFDPDVAAELAVRSKATGVRVLAIRRDAIAPSGPSPVGRRVFVAHGGPVDSWLVTTTVEHESAVVDQVDFGAVASGTRPGPGDSSFETVTEPLWLVCTHAGRDACCGKYGRPVAVSLAQLRPGAVWECSHPGGHRFAANLLTLPLGLLYGRVTPLDVERLTKALARGEVELDLLRGRAEQAPEVQAAEHFLRVHLDYRGISGFHPATTQPRTDDESSITFAVGIQRWEVTVRPVTIGARSISCGTEDAEDPGSFALVTIRRVDWPQPRQSASPSVPGSHP